jgi:anti-anti-sigma factor
MMTSSTAESGTICLRLAGALDADGASTLRPGFEALVETARQDVVLDLSHVGYLDGAGIGAVAYLFKRLTAQGRRLTLRGAQGQPLATLRELGLGRVFGLEAPGRRGFGFFGKGLAWAR